MAMSTPEPEAPELTELTELRRRVAELEQMADAYHATRQRLAETEDWLHALLDSANDVMGICERGIIVEVNHQFSTMFGYTNEEVIGKPVMVVHPPEVRDMVMEKIHSGDTNPYEAPCLRKDGTVFLAEIRGKATSYRGRPARVTLLQDITAQRQAEETLRAALVQQEVIRAQESMLAELSTPLLPITDDILVLPVIGAVTAARARQVIEVLTEGVARNRAKIAILDITGVPDADHHVADALLKAARSVELLAPG